MIHLVKHVKFLIFMIRFICFDPNTKHLTCLTRFNLYQLYNFYIYIYIYKI
jgi:hypothetical protein